MRDRLNGLIARKRTIAQIIAAKPLADLDETWGKGLMKPDQFLTLVHASLMKKPGSSASGDNRGSGARSGLNDEGLGNFAEPFVVARRISSSDK